ncbi:MAG: 30S ribosomal protein S8 [Planctomycetes bacterium SM23_32]|nr:MAG: 30S ribosomal protein S8 [Planctomycetes bacterium SM23_32]
MMTDPIADMLTRIRNALLIEQKTVEMPSSKMKESIARVLKDEGFIEDYRVAGELPRRLLKLYLKYGSLGEKVIREIERVSKPGRRIYRSVGDIGHVRNGLGIWVVSTSRGVLSDRECRQLNVGGEVICSVF